MTCGALWTVLLCSTCMLSFAGEGASQSSYTLESPNKRIEVRVHATDRISYDVLFKGKTLLRDSRISIDIDHNQLGLNPKVVGSKQRSADQVLEPVVRQKFAKILENYNELRLEFEGYVACDFRA